MTASGATAMVRVVLPTFTSIEPRKEVEYGRISVMAPLI